MNLDEWINKYCTHFDDSFPIYALPAVYNTDEKMIELIKKCIMENKKVTDYFPYEEDSIY